MNNIIEANTSFLCYVSGFILFTYLSNEKICLREKRNLNREKFELLYEQVKRKKQEERQQLSRAKADSY